MIYNYKIKIIFRKNYHQTIFYSFNENTTFDDLLEYIAYLIKDENICHCFIFSYYYNYKSYEINDFNAKIIDYKYILDNLYL